MADESTRRALARAQRTRSALAFGSGLAAGLLARATTGFNPLKSLWDLYETWIIAVPGAEGWLRSSVASQPWAGWLSAPILLALLFAAIGRSRIGAPILEWMVPDPPWFAASDLDAERRRTMLNLERQPVPFVGRGPLLSELEEFGAGRTSFQWRMVVGPSGIGKTRLAIEWLEQMRGRRWDVGVVRTESLESLRGWKPRKPTALFVDDARRLWDKRLGELLTYLAEASRPDRPVRVLVADQSPLAIELALAERREAMAGLQAEALRVPILPEEDLALLQEQAGSPASSLVAQAAGGRPRAVLIMLRSPQSETYASALRHWVLQMLPGLIDDSTPFPLAVGGPLLLSSLAGPMPMSRVRAVCGDIDPTLLARFYDEAEASRLEETLPLLEPDDLAAALVLELLARFDPQRRAALVAAALSSHLATMEARLAALSDWQADDWAGAGSDSRQVELLRWLQGEFDAFAPDRVESVRSAARALLGDLGGVQAFDAGVALARDLCDLARSRPFDPVMRSLECKAVAAAIRLCGEPGRFDAMASWTDRLIRILPVREKLRDWSLSLSVIAAVMAAADVCAAAGRAQDLKFWKGRLDALTLSLSEAELRDLRPELAAAYANLLHGLGLNRQFEEMEDAGNRIRILAAQGATELEMMADTALACTHALCVYGQFGRVPDMKRWMAELTEVARSPRFTSEPEIRLLEARGLSDAMGHFGHLGLFGDLEDCGRALTEIVAIEPFSGDVHFRLREAEGASIAVKYYGEAGDFRALERWGGVLNALAEDPRFEAEPRIRRRQLHGVVSASWSYGLAEKLDELLRWAEIGHSVATDPRFALSAEVQEVASSLAVNLTNRTGAVRRFDEMEKWGRMLVRLSETPDFVDDYDIQNSVAKGAGNVIGRLARGNSSDDAFARWMGFLGRHAQHYPAHPGIQEVAGKFKLTATEQFLGHFPVGRVEPRSHVSAPHREPGEGHAGG
jgi:hypothetical protein